MKDTMASLITTVWLFLNLILICGPQLKHSTAAEKRTLIFTDLVHRYIDMANKLKKVCDACYLQTLDHTLDMFWVNVYIIYEFGLRIKIL